MAWKLVGEVLVFLYGEAVGSTEAVKGFAPVVGA